MIRLGPFQLIEPAGHGAMAEVWRGIHLRQRVLVAVKIVTARAGREARYRKLFAREVRAVARLDHPGVVRVYDHGEIDEETAEASGWRLPPDAPYLVMDWLAGGPLRAQLPLDWPTLRATLLSLLDALAHAHARGVVHRDLKPDNVLVDGDRCRLTDFGIARPSTANTSGRFRVTRRTDPTMLGTPHFMAPEQIEGRWRDQGPWTDLYSFGCMVYE
ncbi:MAG: serine/threonine protein kinase, partial [Myxococcales bacterium]|nr:serine/threonine protein kinase [Myxococcales bacterium]